MYFFFPLIPTKMQINISKPIKFKFLSLKRLRRVKNDSNRIGKTQTMLKRKIFKMNPSTIGPLRTYYLDSDNLWC